MKDNFLSRVIAGNWHRVKIVILPDTPRTLRDEDFYKPISNDVVERLQYECKEWCGSKFGFACNKCDAVSEIQRLKELSKELLDSLTEMADKEMLTAITVRLRDAAQAMEKAVCND